MVIRPIIDKLNYEYLMREKLPYYMISVIEKISNFDRMITSLAIVLWCFLFIVVATKNFLFLVVLEMLH